MCVGTYSDIMFPLMAMHRCRSLAVCYDTTAKEVISEMLEKLDSDDDPHHFALYHRTGGDTGMHRVLPCTLYWRSPLSPTEHEGTRLRGAEFVLKYTTQSPNFYLRLR